MLYIVLFGAPGSGKGTHSQKIVNKYGLVHLSTGVLLRSEISRRTVLGEIAAKYINIGKLVPDNVVVEMVKQFLINNDNKNGVLFDGFPRTLNQAITLDKFLSERKESISKVFLLDVEDEILIKRILLRGNDSERSDDHDIKVIRNRFAVYHKQSGPIENYYNEKNKLVTINGNGSIEDIFSKICTELKPLLRVDRF